MRYATLLLALFVLAACEPSSQQPAVLPSPYAGQEQQALKALTPEQVTGLLNGEGMGYARVAELNQYPGPRHILDLADQLRITDEQRAATEQIFAAMQTEAKRLGQELITQEVALEAVFRQPEAMDTEVQALLREIGLLEANLRWTHLRAHLAMKRLLTSEQLQHYDALRGYTEGPGAHDGGHTGHSM